MLKQKCWSFSVVVDERSLVTTVFMIIEKMNKKWLKQTLGTEYSMFLCNYFMYLVIPYNIEMFFTKRKKEISNTASYRVFM